jgi:hypothetical protein
MAPADASEARERATRTERSAKVRDRPDVAATCADDCRGDAGVIGL